MLANGAALGYKETKEGASYTDLAGLKEIPEIGSISSSTTTARRKALTANSAKWKHRRKPIILRKLIRMERKLSLRHSPL